MSDLKLELWEVLRPGSLRSSLTGWDIEMAASRARIPTDEMLLVRFMAVREGLLTILSAVVDASGKTTDEAVEHARQAVLMRRVVID